MSLSIAFWVLMLIWAIFSLFTVWPGSSSYIGGYGFFGHSILIFALFFLLGWHSFGPLLHG